VHHGIVLIGTDRPNEDVGHDGFGVWRASASRK
jgi:hypothetical protein